jgi:hypothetical protein
MIVVVQIKQMYVFLCSSSFVLLHFKILFNFLNQFKINCIDKKTQTTKVYLFIRVINHIFFFVYTVIYGIQMDLYIILGFIF